MKLPDNDSNFNPVLSPSTEVADIAIPYNLLFATLPYLNSKVNLQY